MGAMFSFYGHLCEHQIFNVYKSLGIIAENQLSDVKHKSDLRMSYLKEVSKVIYESILGNDVGSIVNDYFLDLFWTINKRRFLNSLNQQLYDTHIKCVLITRRIVIEDVQYTNLLLSIRKPPCTGYAKYLTSIMSIRLPKY